MLRKIALIGFLPTIAFLTNAAAQTADPNTKDEKSKKGVVFIVDPNAADNPAPPNEISEKIRKEANVACGVINGSAISLPKPVYPAAAMAVRAGGVVNVQVLIDEEGNVPLASAVSGHPLLRQACEQAALGAKFKPSSSKGQPIKVSGVIVYNFIPPAASDAEGIPVLLNAPPADSKTLSLGVVNGKAVSLPKPAYPAAARAVGAEGAVNVQVLIDEEGNVVSAQAVSGHPLLRQAAHQAALGAKFKPTLLGGQPVKVSGVMIYNFVGPVPRTDWAGAGFSLGSAETKGLSFPVNLPDEFSNEKRQLEMVRQLSPEEQSAQITTVISRIETGNLSPADMWRFKFGLAKGRILSNAENENSVLMNLMKIKELTFNKPEAVSDVEFNRAAELAKFADKGSLTKEDKETIFSYLR